MKKLNKERKDFEERLSNAFVNKDGMICLGWNEIHPSSPFGKSIAAKNKNISDKLNRVNEVI